MSRRRRSVSRIGRNPSKIESVDAKNGGGESAVDARRFSILVVIIAKKSLAVKDGSSGGREERPMKPEMDVHSRFGIFSLRLTKVFLVGRLLPTVELVECPKLSDPSEFISRIPSPTEPSLKSTKATTHLVAFAVKPNGQRSAASLQLSER